MRKSSPRGAFAAALAALALCLAAPATVLAGSYEQSIQAARAGDTATLADLLNRGIDADTVDESGNTLLIIALREGHDATADAILRYRPRLDKRNRAGDSALMIATLRGDEERVKLLLAKGAPVDHDGWTPLHYAAHEGNLVILDLLLGAGANINALTPSKADALMLAAHNGHLDMVKRLLQTSIALDRKNDRGHTAETWARAKGNTDIADLIQATRNERLKAQKPAGRKKKS
jgi:ankyrin repeat protein